jgi:hypothetical protein
MSKPARSRLPLSELNIEWHGHPFSLPYFYREGSEGPAILFVHGLGGAKENFYWALQSPALADCTLAMFDELGTGLSEFRPKAELDVWSLAEMTQVFADRILPGTLLVSRRKYGRVDRFAIAPARWTRSSPRTYQS